MLKRLLRDERGSGLVEFAIVLPFMLVLYLGGYVMSDMIACNRKVTLATRALADMTSRAFSPTLVAASPSTTSATAFLNAAAVVMTPYGVANATEQISLLRICDQNNAYVVWTQAQTQTPAQIASNTATAATSTLTAGTLPSVATQSANSVVALPSGFVAAGSPLIPASPDGSDVCTNYAPGTSTVTQVGTAGAYVWVATINYTYTPAVAYSSFSATTFTDTIYMSPRLN